MFRTLKLFDRINCPDNQPPSSTCSRLNCLFNHFQAQPLEQQTEKPKPSVPSSSTKRKDPPPSDQPINFVPPRIEISKHRTNSHTFPSIRQKLLETLYQEYLKLYQASKKMSDLQAHTAAQRDSLQEELNCLRASSQKTYRNTVISKIVKIRKRTLNNSISITGTTTEFDQINLKTSQPPKP
ncbi:hypothetical protein MJO28_010359 [Puccinia striiformis f. sp. tritici]|uniref:C3H1-type domain-containing protein n=4 Tax=Puccinia striiformis TaxID=27350 RepID=A0A0L0W2J6_9BASI|nr:uncharacterized protein Pst134EA_031536 [Puccinia striiformis f. sp. tritici]XP_047803079.1 hypothetical protein Pst134EA_019159 [Puccinia striiformis f. sp. tritici]KAI9613830.1 hypothetical protein H4Q26_009680 [Puccinia striiformis f. sp. tritici PST-130]KNF05702.1 hypothetical protein PSTG_01105 [Puccinia striiformis f. sp. tritici PST-78]POV98856.1 hypothetical protein PSHT_13825 [Puccinia striiformis]KAH9442784.1 hypothetical protein Pst134EA_031536 [Puccinia striiformis f. sp. tritic